MFPLVKKNLVNILILKLLYSIGNVYTVRQSYLVLNFKEQFKVFGSKNC